MSSPPVAPGDVLAGKFLVERVLGEGGMGIVVAARNMQLDLRVAIKFLRPQALLNPEFKERFAREARAVTRLKNEHVARVLDVGVLDNGSPYIVMEHLEGSDLADVLAARKRLPVGEAVDYVLQACEAIAEAHAMGIVHRDLKPANLFVTRGSDGLPLVKLLDFGISKLIGSDTGTAGAALTGTADLLGSPIYMSPEQLQSTKDVDRRTDVWALGVILYELIAGAQPFIAESLPQLCTQILTGVPKPISQRVPGLPPALWAILAKCLEKDRNARYSNVSELAAALAELTMEGPRRSASVRRIEAGPLAPPTIPTLPGGADTGVVVASWGATIRSSPSRRIVTFSVAAAVLLAGAAFGGRQLLLARARSPEHGLGAPPSAAPPPAPALPETAQPPMVLSPPLPASAPVPMVTGSAPPRPSASPPAASAVKRTIPAPSASARPQNRDLFDTPR